MKQLASYFGVSLSAAYKWSAETIRRKTIIMESGAEPEIIKLIGEISQLCYVYNCKSVIGTSAASYVSLYANAESACFYIQKDGESGSKLILLDGTPTAFAELQKVKATLESFIY